MERPDNISDQQWQALQDQIYYYRMKLADLWCAKGIRPVALKFRYYAELFAKRDLKNGKLHTF